jgi:V-type H+-transporting ATPase subunit a
MDMTFSNIAGVVLQSEQDRFARTLFRATRGNTFTHFQPISEAVKDPKTGKDALKSVFVVYYQDNRGGGTVSAMADKIKKIAASFGVSTYPWPADREEAERRKAGLT